MRPSAKLQDAARAAGRAPGSHERRSAKKSIVKSVKKDSEIWSVLRGYCGPTGHNVIYRCEDGLCGSCWHVSEKTGDIYQLLRGGTVRSSAPDTDIGARH